MNAVWNSYGQLCGCPEIFKKSCKFFCRELDIRVAQAVIIKIDSKLLPDDSLAIGKAVFGCQLSVFINADKIDSPRACGKDFLCADNSLSRRSFFVRKIDKLIYCVEFAIFQFVFKLSVFLCLEDSVKGFPEFYFPLGVVLWFFEGEPQIAVDVPADKLTLYRQRAVFKINIVPCEGKALIDTQPTVPANHKRNIVARTNGKAFPDAVKFCIRQHDALSDRLCDSTYLYKPTGILSDILQRLNSIIYRSREDNKDRAYGRFGIALRL